MAKKVIYPLSADPFTLGHKSVVERIVELFPDREIHVIIADNRDKKHMFETHERLEITKASLEYPKFGNVKIIPYGGILSDYAEEHDVGVIIRGVRNATDLDYEIKLEQFTRATSHAETIYLTPYTEHLNTSSSLVRMFLQSNNLMRATRFMDPKAYRIMESFIEDRWI